MSRFTSLSLAFALLVGCSVSAPALPSIDVPSFDTATIQELVADAVAEVERAIASPPALELPPEVTRLLDENNIALPSLPSNAAEICGALGTPGVGTVASAGLAAVIENLLAIGESGLVIGLLVTVVSRSCPVWMPHLETAIEELL